MTSTSAARAPPARTKTAAAAASIAIFFIFPFLSDFLELEHCTRGLPGSRPSDIAAWSCRCCASAISGRNSGLRAWQAVEACFGRGYALRPIGTRISMASVDRSLVANLPMFAGLSPAEQDELLREARSIRYPKGTAVFDQGRKRSLLPSASRTSSRRKNHAAGTAVRRPLRFGRRTVRSRPGHESDALSGDRGRRRRQHRAGLALIVMESPDRQISGPCFERVADRR